MGCEPVEEGACTALEPGFGRSRVADRRGNRAVEALQLLEAGQQGEIRFSAPLLHTQQSLHS